MREATGVEVEILRALAAAETRFAARRPLSAARQAFAARHMPGGNTRTVLHHPPFPLCFATGRGNRLTDVDGFEYIDLLGEYSAGLYGHSEPRIQAAIRQALDDGIVLGGPNVYEARLAEAIRARFPSIELLRFTNSGTEANLYALSALRALRPGRPRVLVFDGAYHGGVFYFRDGAAQLNVPFDWLIGEYNDTAGTRVLLRAHAASLAAVLVEPVLGGGCIPASAAFLHMLREECTAQDVPLVFDEVMTSRLSPAGRQGLLGIRPDLTTLGKYLGGGLSFGAFGGCSPIMRHFDPYRADALSHAGTFNNNVLSMAAGLAGLTQVFTPAEAHRINALGDRLREQLNGLARARALPFLATGLGSLVGLHFSRRSVLNGADGDPADTAAGSSRLALQALFHLELLEHGYHVGRRGYIALSLPTTEADCDRFVAAVGDILGQHAALIQSVVD